MIGWAPLHNIRFVIFISAHDDNAISVCSNDNDKKRKFHVNFGFAFFELISRFTYTRRSFSFPM